MFLLSVYTSKMFYASYTHTYVHRDILNTHLKMAEVWSKSRVLLFIFIVKINIFVFLKYFNACILCKSIFKNKFFIPNLVWMKCETLKSEQYQIARFYPNAEKQHLFF